MNLKKMTTRFSVLGLIVMAALTPDVIASTPADPDLIPGGLVPAATPGLEFELIYKENKSQPPPWDVDGRILKAHMRAAAEIWEAAFADIDNREVIRIRFFWRNNPGMFQPDDVDASINKRVSTEGETYTIRFYKGTGLGVFIDWYDDPSLHPDVIDDYEGSLADLPNRDSEFDMRQHLYRDSNTIDVEVFDDSDYDADCFEVAYSGEAKSDTLSGNDLLSSCLHELGHALLWPGRGDDPWSVDASYSGGVALLVWKALRGTHFGSEKTLMNPYGAVAGERSLPSRLDIAVIASVREWEPRFHRHNYFLFTVHDSGNLWYNNVNNHWLSRQPGSDDGAFLDDAEIRRLRIRRDTALRQLYVAQSANLRIKGLLGVTEQTVTDSDGAIIHVNDEGRLDSGSIRIDSGLLDVNNGFVSGRDEVTIGDTLDYENDIARVTGNHARLSSQEKILVNGELHLRGDPRVGAPYFKTTQSIGRVHGDGVVTTRFLNNSGEIEAENGDLHFLNGTLYDLDGKAELKNDDNLSYAEILATWGSITFEGPVNDEFNGQMKIGGTEAIRCTEPLALGATREDFYPTMTMGDDSTFEGPHLVLADGAWVRSGAARSAPAWIDAQLTIDGGALVSVDPGNAIVFLEQTDFQGGLVEGSGWIYQVGPATIHADTLIDVSHYVWDGQGGWGYAPSNTEILPGTTLHITGSITGSASTTVGDPDFGYSGEVSIGAGATLQVDESPWIVDGLMNLYGGSVSGGRLDNYGEVRGTGTIAARFTNNGVVTVDAGDTLHIDHAWVNVETIVLRGGTITGGQVTNSGLIMGHGRIEAEVVNAGSVENDGLCGDIDFVGGYINAGGTCTGISGSCDCG